MGVLAFVCAAVAVLIATAPSVKARDIVDVDAADDAGGVRDGDASAIHGDARRRARRRPGGDGGAQTTADGCACGDRCKDGGSASAGAPSVSMVLELLAVTMSGGASISRALDDVGAVIGGEMGHGLRRASAMLLQGADWESAWRYAGGTGDGASPCDKALGSVARILGPSWRHGISPIPRMESAVERLAQERAHRIVVESASLSTTVLLPMGLCFLPAFVLLSVVPMVASWGALALW